MAAPVWVLSVDLQTKTATFQSGMADAAKSARGSFNEIKTGSSEMGGHISTNMFASRHAIMAVSEAFGDTMPRAITALLVHIGPLGTALEAAFPFAAIALAAVLLIEHLAALREAGIKLTEDQMKFGTAVQSAFNQLDQRLIQASIKSDELRNDHLGALRGQLELINRQSMAELVHSFGEVAKAADVVFADLKSNWHTMGIGSEGAKHALDEFQTKYDSLLAQGKDKEASDLLRGTRESAEKVLAMQSQFKATPSHTQIGSDDAAAYTKHLEAQMELQRAGVGVTENEVRAQQTLVDSLRAQATIEEKVAALKKADSGNAKTETGKELGALAAEAARQAAEHRTKMAELALQAEREQAQAALSIREAGAMERLLADLRLADKERDIQLAGNAALQSALDKGGKDYNNQLRALKEKAEEITAQHGTTVAGLTAKAMEAQNRQTLTDLEQSEREKIEATEKGSRARIAEIDAAIRDEQILNLQHSAFYRELMKSRVEAVRQAQSEEDKLTAEAGKGEAEHIEKMGELALAAEKEQTALRDSSRRVTIQMRIAEEVKAANDEYALKLAVLQREAEALNKGAQDYENRRRAIQNKEVELTRAHENAITEIKDKAEMERNAKILAASNRFNDEIASGLSEVLMGHKSFASMMGSIGDQIVSGMMQNAIKSILANDMTKESDAAKAGRKGYLAGMEFPFPANVVMAPLLAAQGFASIMAFQEGTDYVPGIGRGDKVPAMLEPGEGVVPGGVMDGLRSMARSGTMTGGTQYHAHVAPVYHLQALDSTGMEKVLDTHARTLQKHVEKTLRGMNH